MPTAYEDRTDIQKIRSQWHKLAGLHSREEWSAAVVRAATAAELSANFAIRREFASRSQFDPQFVDTLLKWANGLSGKIDHLLFPLSVGEKTHKATKTLKAVAADINSKRNSIVHQGGFCNRTEALLVIKQSKEFVETLVRLYEPEFSLSAKHRKAVRRSR